LSSFSLARKCFISEAACQCFESGPCRPWINATVSVPTRKGSSHKTPRSGPARIAAQIGIGRANHHSAPVNLGILVVKARLVALQSSNPLEQVRIPGLAQSFSCGKVVVWNRLLVPAAQPPGPPSANPWSPSTCPEKAIPASESSGDSTGASVFLQASAGPADRQCADRHPAWGPEGVIRLRRGHPRQACNHHQPTSQAANTPMPRHKPIAVSSQIGTAKITTAEQSWLELNRLRWRAPAPGPINSGNAPAIPKQPILAKNETPSPHPNTSPWDDSGDGAGCQQFFDRPGLLAMPSKLLLILNDLLDHVVGSAADGTLASVDP